jgi:glucans biosynthesis protein C
MNKRRYELDWLRVVAIAILILYHTGMIFVSWEWHIKSADTSRPLALVMAWFHYWRMPLLLFISGAATAIVLSTKSAATFARDRFVRLFIPLLFGMFVIVPPQIYFEKIAQFTSYADFYPTVFELVAYPEGSFSWHHLWFVAYLLVYSIVALPLFLFLRSSKATQLFALLRSTLSSRLGFTALLLPVVASQIALRPWFPEETHDLADLSYFVYYLSFFVYGHVLYRDQRLWTLLVERRRDNAIAAVVAAVVMYAAWLVPALPEAVSEPLFDLAAMSVAWFTLLAATGFGAVHLNRPARYLAYANEAVYPVYILHQTVIVVIGYYVIRNHGGAYANFAFISLATFVSCLFIHHFLIRPFALTRLLFGMKPRARPESPMQNELARAA